MGRCFLRIPGHTFLPGFQSSVGSSLVWELQQPEQKKDNIVSLTLGKQAQSCTGSKLQWVGVVVPSADPKNSQTWNIVVQKDPMLHQCSDRILCWLRILELTS